MKNQNRLIELQKQLKMFEDEENNSKKYTEDYKKKISEEIKKLKLAIPKTFDYYKMEKILTGIFG